jgi:hypothetical protein
LRPASRPLLAALAAGAAACAFGVGAAPAGAKSVYCSPTGDYCYSAADERGVVRIRLSTFSFQEPVEVCVSHRKGRECRSFTPRKSKHGLFTFAVRWSRHFPNHGPGNYRVRFRLPGASAFGDPLTFRRG